MDKITVSLNGDSLSIVGQGLEQIPPELGTKYGHIVKRLDLTENSLK
jgi:hypothetical protein